MILMIDNYDSFTFNIVQYLMQMGREVRVYRNDEITPGDITDLAPEAIVLSPGPGRPAGAGISTEVVRRFYKTVPLWVSAGASVRRRSPERDCPAARIMHGKVSSVHHDGGLFYRPRPVGTGRYHSSCSPIPARMPEVSAQTAGVKSWASDTDTTVGGFSFIPSRCSRTRADVY